MVRKTERCRKLDEYIKDEEKAHADYRRFMDSFAADDLQVAIIDEMATDEGQHAALLKDIRRLVC